MATEGTEDAVDMYEDVEGSPEEEFEVEAIIDEVQAPSQLYRVKWQGYGLSGCTWEPYDHLELANEAISIYTQTLELQRKDHIRIVTSRDRRLLDRLWDMLTHNTPTDNNNNNNNENNTNNNNNNNNNSNVIARWASQGAAFQIYNLDKFELYLKATNGELDKTHNNNNNNNNNNEKENDNNNNGIVDYESFASRLAILGFEMKATEKLFHHPCFTSHNKTWIEYIGKNSILYPSKYTKMVSNNNKSNNINSSNNNNNNNNVDNNNGTNDNGNNIMITNEDAIDNDTNMNDAIEYNNNNNNNNNNFNDNENDNFENSENYTQPPPNKKAKLSNNNTKVTKPTINNNNNSEQSEFNELNSNNNNNNNKNNNKTTKSKTKQQTQNTTNKKTRKLSQATISKKEKIKKQMAKNQLLRNHKNNNNKHNNNNNNNNEKVKGIAIDFEALTNEYNYYYNNVIQPISDKILAPIILPFNNREFWLDINQIHLWTEYDVGKWLLCCGVWGKQYINSFIENGIDGRILLEMENIDIISKQCNIKPMDKAHFVWAVNHLRTTRMKCLQAKNN